MRHKEKLYNLTDEKIMKKKKKIDKNKINLITLP